MWRFHDTFILVVCISFWVVPSCDGQCQPDMAMTCMLENVTLDSGGIAMLRKITPNVYFSIWIEVARIPENPFGAFLQRMSEFVDQIQFYTYHEQVFRVLAGTSLTSISLYSAPSLRQLQIVDTVNITTLLVIQCALDSVPPTVSHMETLVELTITQCAIRNFSFDAFTSNPKLTMLDLSHNEISTIVPAIMRAPFELPIENLYLPWNRLETVDMASFASLKALRGLDLSHNNLISVTAQSIVTWPLVDFWSLESNQLQVLDVQRLSAPNLERIILDGNKFTAVPPQLKRFPNIRLIGLSNNLFKTLDLAALGGLPNLNSIDLSFNAEARGIRVSRRTTLPMLTTLYAEHCGLTRFNTTGLDLPLINYISLTGNNFSSVPRLAKTFPSMESFSLEQNPLSCATLQTVSELILSGKLIMGPPTDAEFCAEGHVTLKGSLTVCCKA